MRWTRRAYTDVWESTALDLYGSVVNGATVQQEVWRLSLAGEHANAIGRAAASALAELETAFEDINSESIKYMMGLRTISMVRDQTCTAMGMQLIGHSACH